MSKKIYKKGRISKKEAATISLVNNLEEKQSSRSINPVVQTKTVFSFLFQDFWKMKQIDEKQCEGSWKNMWKVYNLYISPKNKYFYLNFLFGDLFQLYFYCKMHQAKVILFIILLLAPTHTQILVQIDLYNHYTEKSIYLWANIFGIVLELQEYKDSLGDKLFQDYMLNSNLYGSWSNNWMISLQVPKGYIYDCSIYANSSNVPNCVYDMSTNDTFWQNLGDFVWQTTNQPYWTMGFNNEYYNFTVDTYRQALKNYIDEIYFATYYIYHLDIVRSGDKMVENGYREGNYTADDFITEAEEYEDIQFGVYYVAPGITMDASQQWRNKLWDYYRAVWLGVFSFQCIVFKDEADLTIENLLSEEASTQIVKKMFTVNDTSIYSNLYGLARVSKFSLIEGDGIDGVTNTFAAVLWLIDFSLEVSLYSVYDISYYSSGEYQRAIGMGPDYKPNAAYLGLIFLSLIKDGSPKLVNPTLTGTSHNIKIYTFSTYLKKKIVILNKDTNKSLNGTIKIKIQSSKSQKLICTYLSAPSLTSKIEDIRLGGYTYIAGNHLPEGQYDTKKYVYDKDELSYFVNIQYGESALCEVSNLNTHIPEGDCFEEKLGWMAFLVVLLLAL